MDPWTSAYDHMDDLKLRDELELLRKVVHTFFALTEEEFSALEQAIRQQKHDKQ